jgi:hypothetical protein
MGKHKPKSRARDRRKKGFGTKGTVRCDLCQLEAAHGVPGKRHRRCGGSAGAAIRKKHDAGDIRGVWR